MTETSVDNQKVSMWARILYYFIIPVVFASVLTIVLLTITGYDLKTPMMKVAQNIPYVDSLLPKSEEAIAKENDTSEVEKLTLQIAELETQLASANEQIESQTISNKEQRIQLVKLQEEVDTKVDEEITTKVQALKDLYVKMSARKASSILETLTLEEQVLILYTMTAQQQKDILERMEPENAAEASIALKDVASLEDAYVAANDVRQEIVDEREQMELFTLEDISLTFAFMEAKSAAEILAEVYASNNDLVIAILQEIDVASRSSILAEMNDMNDAEGKNYAAAISQSLN
ncbi:hypothetical protein [Longirhabdus pacifica]|uniref:hypothetical protein n=1 Tax=Longirhabdus pacifica TaxID=2305227 RepID=UPI001009162D|nr:hypothetical protein [Longirhabdus pacifica]